MNMGQTLALIPDEPPMVHAHLTVDEMAALIDDRLAVDRRRQMEAHLALCSECRSELVAASALVDSAPARPRVPVRWIAAAAATILALNAVPLAKRAFLSAPTTSERAEVARTTSIRLMSPAGGTQPSLDSLTFAWRAMPSVSTYQLFVTDSLGTPIIALKTTDTTGGTIAREKLVPGASYFWYVDALRSDGSSTTSTPVGFTIRAR